MLLQRILVYCLFGLNVAYCLRCRTEDGNMDADFKRVTRNCMRRMSDQNYKISNNNNNNNRQNNGRQQYNYEYNNNNNQNDYNDYNEGQQWNERREDLMMQRNRQRQQQHFHKIVMAASGNSGNSGYNLRGGATATSSTSSSSSSSSANNNGNNRHNNNNNNNNHTEIACITLCFFEELNMLNSDEYPDRQKMNYMLTKDLRDRELRNFYTETIQQCFRYIDSQRRREKCHYARELIKCMTEYAKANCDDWEEYESLLFN